MLKLKFTYSVCKIICVLSGCQFYKYVESITQLTTFILESTATWHRPQISLASPSPLKQSQRKVVISSISLRPRNKVCLVVKYEFFSSTFVFLYVCAWVRACFYACMYR